MLEIKSFVQSDPSLCGPAVIKMVLNYYGIEASESEIAERCHHTYEVGCNDLQMKEALEAYGLAVKIYENSTIEDLRYWVNHRIPVIIDWFSVGYGDDVGEGHSSIVVDVDTERVYIVDPWNGELRKIKHNDFMRVWFDWRNDAYIKTWENMILRQAMIAYPKRLVD